MPKSKKPRKQKSKANNRSTGTLKFEVSEDMMAIAMKIKALEATPNIDIVRPQAGSRYLGSKKGLFSSNETSITVLHCSERDEHGDFQVECHDEMGERSTLNAYNWALQLISIGNEGEYTMRHSALTPMTQD
ncbi:hypothetical protein K0W35_004420 [Vibrio parahaemolyticus]|nr:hypothetical protein [Vibrio parahaemolyticus]